MIDVTISVPLAFLSKNQDKQANPMHTLFMFNPNVIDNVPLKKPTTVRITIVTSIHLDIKFLLLLSNICHISPLSKFFCLGPYCTLFFFLRYDSNI